MKYGRSAVFLLAAIVAVVILIGYYAKNRVTSTLGTSSTSAALAINASLPMKIISIGTTTVQVEIASTNAQREQGLSDRTSLVPGRGMLFVFDPPRAVGFWMKDMHFSLDMVFADAAGTITRIDTNISPDTYPQIFPSGAPIMYVLEIPAGYATATGIAVGAKIVVQ